LVGGENGGAAVTMYVGNPGGGGAALWGVNGAGAVVGGDGTAADGRASGIMWWGGATMGDGERSLGRGAGVTVYTGDAGGAAAVRGREEGMEAGRGVAMAGGDAEWSTTTSPWPAADSLRISDEIHGVSLRLLHNRHDTSSPSNSADALTPLQARQNRNWPADMMDEMAKK